MTIAESINHLNLLFIISAKYVVFDCHH